MSTGRLDGLALAGTVVLLAALQLWLRPLMPVDETRYLAVAWEMWARGDFLVPRLNAEPYSHKPPLLFWLIHALWALVGVSELVARLLPVGLALAALWASARLTERLWPESGAAARLVPWLLFGGLFWNNFFSLVQFDLLLVLAALAAWHGVLTALSDPLRGWLLTATAIGFGVLGKGPVILVPVVPAIIFAPWWARSLLTGGRVRWYTGGLAALLLGAGIALAWAIPAGLTGGEAYRQAIFWGQSAGRVLDSFAHRNPWWSYLLWLPLMWLPWVAWPHLWAAVRRQRWDQGSRFCLAVLVPALAGLSLISGKQPKYLLPLFPLIAAWLARALVLAEGDSRRYRMIFLAALLGGSGIALAVVPWLAVGPDWLARVQSFWGLALLVWAVLFSFLRLPLAAAVRATALGTTLWTAVAYLALLEPARPVFDVAPVSRVVARLQDSGHSLAYLGRYHGQFHFTGRLRRRIEPLRERHELEGWLRGHPDGYLVVNYKKPRPDVPQSLSVYPYRGGSLVLWPVARLLADPARLDALPGNA